MQRHEFSNWMSTWGGGNQLVTELVRLTDYVKVHPRHATQILALFDADVAKVRADLIASGAVPPVTPEE